MTPRKNIDPLGIAAASVVRRLVHHFEHASNRFGPAVLERILEVRRSTRKPTGKFASSGCFSRISLRKPSTSSPLVSVTPVEQMPMISGLVRLWNVDNGLLDVLIAPEHCSDLAHSGGLQRHGFPEVTHEQSQSEGSTALRAVQQRHRPRSPMKASAPPMGWLIFSGLTVQAFFPTGSRAIGLRFRRHQQRRRPRSGGCRHCRQNVLQPGGTKAKFALSAA